MLFYVLWAITYRGFFLVCHMLWVMLASLLFHLIHLNLANLFHQLLLGMLHELQYLNKEVGIVNRGSFLLLWPSLCSINTFRLIGLVGLVGLDFACESTVLMFRVVFDVRGITCKGFICFPYLFPNSQVKSPI